MNTIEDYKLEITLLQKKDTENALTKGFDNKTDWYNYIIKEETDDIANAILDIAERYNVPALTVALNFDASMVPRIKKVQKARETTAKIHF